MGPIVRGWRPSCHSSSGRLDWKALGYDEDPLEAVLKGDR
jgi:hypothetical protein